MSRPSNIPLWNARVKESRPVGSTFTQANRVTGLEPARQFVKKFLAARFAPEMVRQGGKHS
jgi:hypothetical protein